LLLDEIDCAVDYSQQCRALVDSVCPSSEADEEPGVNLAPPAQVDRMVLTETKHTTGDKSIAPRLNALANQRNRLMQYRLARANNPIPPKTLAWSRGVSATSLGSSRVTDPMQPVGLTRSRPSSTPSHTKDSTGTRMSGARVSFTGRATIPKEEEQVTTRDWLRKYSLRNLGLTLTQLVSSAACRHDMAYVTPIRSHVEARYCTGLFPIVNVAGTLRHLQYTYGELEVFKKELFLRGLSKTFGGYTVRDQYEVQMTGQGKCEL
uniref:Myosin motor domain-containing protein n=1 Tax=Echinostoma caproni TaxID=27848 RepID=A0A183BAZ6_9TREM